MNPVIEAAQRRTTLVILNAQLRAGKITVAAHEQLSKKAGKRD